MSDCWKSPLSVELATAQGPLYAVDDLNVALQAGETFALLGESGCGKSMTALALMRLLPDAGFVAAAACGWKSANCCSLRKRRCARCAARHGMIFQEPATSLNPVLTVAQQIGEVLATHRGLSGSKARDEAGDAARGGHSGSGAAPGRISVPVLRRHEAARHDRHGAGREHSC